MKFSTVALGLLAAALCGGQAAAQELFQIPVGEETRIYRHGVCRYVTNNGAFPIMVPTGSSAEWGGGSSSFLANLADMDRVNVQSCIVWEDRRGPTKSFSVTSHIDTEVTWIDGTTNTVKWIIGNRPATYYDPVSGDCAPVKSFIEYGPSRNIDWIKPLESTDDDPPYMLSESRWVLLCDSDGMATRPFKDVSSHRGANNDPGGQNYEYEKSYWPPVGDWIVSQTVAGFDNR